MSPNTDHTEVRYRDLVELSTDYIFAIDEKMRIRSCNQALCHFLKKEQPEIEGRLITDIFPKSTGRNVIKFLKRIFDSGHGGTYETTAPGTQKMMWMSTAITLTDGPDPGSRMILGMSRDITDQKLAQTARRKSEEQLRLITDYTSDNIGILTFELKPKYIYVNRSIKRLLGYDPEDLIGKSFFDFVHPDDAPYPLSLLKQYLKEGITNLIKRRSLPLQQIMEYRFRAKSGEYRTLQSTINLADGHILSVTRDITEQQAAKTALEESEMYLATLMGNLPGIAYRCKLNPSWTMLYLSSGCEDLTGYKPEYLINDDEIAYNDLIIPEDQEKVWTAVQNATKKKQSFELEYRIRNKDQQTVWVWERGREVDVDDDGTSILEGFITDISHRKEAEAELQSSMDREQKLAEIVRTAPIGIGYLFPDGHIENTNQTFRDLADYTEEELLRLDIRKTLIPPEWAERDLELLSSITPEKTSISFETEMRHRKGHRIPVSLTISASFDAGGNPQHYLFFIQDITDRKEAQYQLLESEFKFRSLYQNSPYGIFICELNRNNKNNVIDYTHIESNQVAPGLLGLKPEDLVDVKGSELFEPELFHKLLKHLEEGVRSGKSLNITENIPQLEKTFNIRAFSLDADTFILHLIDNTDQARIIQDLEASEERFALAINATQDGLYDWNLTTNEIYYSPSWKRMLGYEDHELPNDFSVWEDLTTPEDVARSLEMQQELIRGERKDFEITFKMKHKQGHWVDILSRANAVFDMNGQATRIVGTHTDITDRLQISEDLRKSEERYRLATEASNQGIWDWWTDAEEVYYNDTWKAQLGYEPHELGNNFSTWELLLHPEDKARMLSAVDGFLSSSAEIFEEEFRMIHKNGEPIWIHNRASSVRDDDGKVIRMFGSHTDITVRKKAELRVLEQQRNLNYVIEGTNAGTWDLDLVDGKATLNDRWAAIAGYALDELGEMTREKMHDFIHPDDQARVSHLFELHNKNISNLFEAEFRQHHKSGEWIWVVSRGKISERDKDGNALRISGTILDISNRKQIEKEHRQVEAQLHQAMKLEALGTMVGGIAHDFNNILQSMFLYGQVLESELADHPEQTEDLKQILRGAKRARDLVKQILTFSRKSDVELKSQTVHKVILDAVSFVRASTPANIEIVQKIDINCGRVLCDKTQIHQIALNLCNNARQAIGDQPGEISVHLKQIQTPPDMDIASDEVVVLSVNDTGAGMDQLILDRIFDPFFTTKGIGEGTGLGLSMIHGIVKLMNGDIQVSSSPGEGSTFTIYMPLAPGLDHEAGKEGDTLDAPSNLNILLVDDESDIRIAGKRLLEQAGHHVISTDSGKAALEILEAQKESFDLIITDMVMPGMSGIDLCHQIRANGLQIPVLLSTGNLGIEQRENTLQSGFNGYIQKPWTAFQLQKSISQVMRGDEDPANY